MVESTKARSLWIVACLPILGIAILTSSDILLNLANPCTTWGANGSPVSVSEGGTCTSLQSFSETAQQAIFGLILIQGGIIAGVGLAITGVLRGKPYLVAIASMILFVESIPLVFSGLFVFSLLPAALLLPVGLSKKPKPTVSR